MSAWTCAINRNFNILLVTEELRSPLDFFFALSMTSIKYAHVALDTSCWVLQFQDRYLLIMLVGLKQSCCCLLWEWRWNLTDSLRLRERPCEIAETEVTVPQIYHQDWNLSGTIVKLGTLVLMALMMSILIVMWKCPTYTDPGKCHVNVTNWSFTWRCDVGYDILLCALYFLNWFTHDFRLTKTYHEY